MADYKRLVSYIYAYPGGVRDKNVGFAKAEVRNGQFKLTVSVKGVYTDTPELFGVYVMVDGKKHQPGGFTLLKTGTVMVNQGIGQYQYILQPYQHNTGGFCCCGRFVQELSVLRRYHMQHGNRYIPGNTLKKSHRQAGSYFCS